MKATINKEITNRNAVNYSGKKELIERFVVITKTETEYKEIITASCWMSYNADGAAPVYASIWIHANDFYTSGKGKAHGYGYHKTSSAISGAIESAGVKLDEDIDGRGTSAIKEVLTAIALEIGYSDIYIVN